MKFLSKIKWAYYRFYKSPEAYARFLGAKIGDKCNIISRNFPSESYLITIGNNVAVTSGVYMHTHGGSRVARHIYSDFDVFGKIVVEDNVYIGTGAQIMPGVTIGAGALIAAGSIVTKSVPKGMVVAGNPARVICCVEDYIKRNLPYNLNTKELSGKDKRKYLLSLTDDRFIRK